MAGQQALVLQTVLGLKAARDRTANASDSESSINRHSNRGNKLKRKAQFVHEGHLNDAWGSRSYKKKIDHAGFTRYIITQNPSTPSDEDEGSNGEDAYVDRRHEAAHPYSEIKLEELLAPLTSAGELSRHPSLSLPYYSKHITHLSKQASDMLQNERTSLWSVKRLFMRFLGDGPWAPCGNFESNADIDLFETANPPEDGDHEIIGVGGDLVTLAYQVSKPAPTNVVEDHNPDETGPDAAGGVNEDGSLGTRASSTRQVTSRAEEDGLGNTGSAEREIARSPEVVELAPVTREAIEEEPGLLSKSNMAIDAKDEDIVIDPVSAGEAGTAQLINAESLIAETQSLRDSDLLDTKPSEMEEEEKDLSQAPARRMTTRAQTLAQSNPPSAQLSNQSNSHSRSSSVSSTSSHSTIVHPFFIPTLPTHTSPDFSLPPDLAEEFRRLLLLYVQKQEEVVRGCTKLQQGLLKADRMRKDVLGWARAEEHIGEMSDGEDWVDREQLGLEDGEELKKGQNEEEEEAERDEKGKKTRQRRG